MTSERRITLVATLLLLVVTSIPYLVAYRWPPRGTEFSGTFFYPDDFYQYISFAEQAMRGRFVFENKSDIQPHTPSIVNLEWWLGGTLGRLLGGRPILGFHALRPLAFFLFVSAVVRLLTRAGLRGRRLAWALVLFFSAAGLGAVRLWQGTAGWHIPDLLMTMYPWHQCLTSAHTALGTGLALWALALFLEWRAGESRWPAWLLVAWILALVRPYDLVTLGVTTGVLVLVDFFHAERRQRFWPNALSVAGLLPAFGYYFWITRVQRSVRGWDGTQNGDLNPPIFEFIYAFAPALVLIGLALWKQKGAWRAPEGRDVKLAAAVWSVFLMALVVFYDSPFMKTFVPALAVMTMLLAALFTPERWLPLATLALAPTSLFLLWRVLNPWPVVFFAADYFRATDLLAARCAPRDVALAPSDLSMMVAALTPCSVALGHRSSTPDYNRRMAEGNRFYHDATTPPAWRRSYLDEIRARFVFLAPGTSAWLRADPAWTPIRQSPQLEIWERRP